LEQIYSAVSFQTTVSFFVFLFEFYFKNTTPIMSKQMVCSLQLVKQV